MLTPKICSSATKVAATLHATMTAATTSHWLRLRTISGRETASSAYSANFAAVTACVNDCERTKIHTSSSAAATHNQSDGRSRANPSRSPSRSAANATTSTARSESSSPR